MPLWQTVTDLFKLGEEKGGWRRFRESFLEEEETRERFWEWTRTKQIWKKKQVLKIINRKKYLQKHNYSEKWIEKGQKVNKERAMCERVSWHWLPDWNTAPKYLEYKLRVFHDCFIFLHSTHSITKFCINNYTQHHDDQHFKTFFGKWHNFQSVCVRECMHAHTCTYTCHSVTSHLLRSTWTDPTTWPSLLWK